MYPGERSRTVARLGFGAIESRTGRQKSGVGGKQLGLGAVDAMGELTQ